MIEFRKMKPQLKIVDNEYFYAPLTKSENALPLAQAIIEKCQRLPEDVSVLISERPLAVEIAKIKADRLLELISLERIQLAQGIVDFISCLGTEVRKGDYYLEALMKEIETLPAFTSSGESQFTVLHALRTKGCQLSDLPGDIQASQETLLNLSQLLSISLEYLLGNLDKAVRLIRLLGVREITHNLSNLFHNFHSGFFSIDPSSGKKIKSTEILERASALAKSGVTLEIFKKGEFNQAVAALSPKDLEKIITDTEESYEVAPGEFRRFIDTVLSREEERLGQTPLLSMRELLACFKFSTVDKNLVAVPAVIQQDDPLLWRQTELGQALVRLRSNLNWLAVSIGIKTAGDLETYQKDEEIRSKIQEITDLAGGYSITLLSGRTQQRTERKISELSSDEILFDLYSLAVLEKKELGEVLETTRNILQFIQKLENREPIVNLNTLIASRLAGEPYVTLLGTQGLILRNAPIVGALEKIWGLGDKVQLTVQSADERTIPIKGIGIDEFRRAIILMGRRLRAPHAPERILAIINDKIVPEIIWLPPQVIADGPHDLSRLVEMALVGIPPRYALRRPWKKINIDQLVSMGNCLEPGIRNCLGCPVNTLYGLVMKTAISSGFEEIITYEATGCFEVYSGIWPYTGKKFPSVHGVFGGAASEMLGGLAAKRARLRYAMKNNGKDLTEQEVAHVLHLGWGGDGATFDIGFGNLSGLFSRLQKILPDELEDAIHQRALYVCYDNEGYQNTGNQYSAATSPGGNTTTNPRGKAHPLGNDMSKKPMVEIVAEHGVPFSARLNIHRQEHITRVVARALEDGDRGSFIHFLQPCTTGWKFTADSLTYELSYLSEEGGLFPPVTIEYGVPYLEMYPTPRNPDAVFLKLQARFKHLLGTSLTSRENMERVLNYYRKEWQRNLSLTGMDGEVPQADNLGYLEEEHRFPRVT